jgi:hypothetical protein
VIREAGLLALDILWPINLLDRKTLAVKIPILKINALHLVGRMFNCCILAAPQLSLSFITLEYLHLPDLSSVAPVEFGPWGFF